MNELAESYLARALEGAEQAQQQLTQARAQMEAQMENLTAQEAEVNKSVAELKEILGLEDEVVEEEA